MVTIAGAIPLLDGETLMSWVGRIARTATGLGPFEFLNFIELNRKDVLEATPAGLDRLTALKGRPRAEIERGAYLRVDRRLYEHRGERFHAEFAGRTRTTYCPACLLDDGRSGNASGGLRVGRINWLFAPVRTCRIHRIPLVRQECTSYAEQFQDMGRVAPGDALLQAVVAQSPTRDVSPLQDYVERRLEGATGPDWLDGQAIDQAARACEMLGAVVRHGPKVELPGLSEDQWDAVGAEGFAFAARGAEGVRAALDGIFVCFRTRLSRAARRPPSAGFTSGCSSTGTARIAVRSGRCSANTSSTRWRSSPAPTSSARWSRRGAGTRSRASRGRAGSTRRPSTGRSCRAA
jgi:hypothetical protein